MTDVKDPTGFGHNKARVRKLVYAEELRACFSKFKSALIICVDNVGSNQLQKLRIALRAKQSQILMGKNTVIRKILADHADAKVRALLPHINGNIGFVFTNETDLKGLRDLVMENKIPAAARAGMVAPSDVVLPAGPSGLDPSQTNFFQALNIATKIVRGAIEIINPVVVCKAGDKVTLGSVALLSKMSVKPFFFGITVPTIYDNASIYSSKVMDLSQADLLTKFFQGVSRVAAVSLAIHHPTAASIPHNVINAYRKCLYISLATDYSFPAAQKLKDLLSDPAALAAAQAAAAPAAGDAAAAAPAAAAAAVEEEEEEEEADFDLFD